MSERNKRPGLSSRPPGPRDLDAFLDGADKPRGERESKATVYEDEFTSPEAEAKLKEVAQAGVLKRPLAYSAMVSALPWEAPGFDGAANEEFKLRMQRRHHAMLQWLKAVTPRKSMNDWALDLLEPAIEAAIKTRLNDLE